MKNISLNIDKVAGFVSKETIAAYESLHGNIGKRYR